MEELDKIIELSLKEINQKKSEINLISNPQFKTSCSFKYKPLSNTDLQIYNLHTISELRLIELYSYLTQLEKTVKQLNILNFMYYDKSICDWKHDIELKLKHKQLDSKIKELKELENSFNELQSEDTKRKLKITELASKLKQL